MMRTQRYNNKKNKNTKGKLILPYNVSFIWAEPAILGIVKRDIRLLKNVPLLQQSSYEVDLEKDISGQITTYKPINKEHLSIQALHKHTLIEDTREIKKGTQVLMRPVIVPSPLTREMVMNPFAYEIAIFNKKEAQNNLPESGRGVEVVATGFAFTEDLKQDKGEYYRNTSEDLFPQEKNTEISDIHQTVFADCFLLSVIGSILAAENDDFFKRSMSQRNSHSIVRFYHPETKKMDYLIVLNKVFCEEKDNTVAHKALWIHVLEKAYAGYAYKLENDNVTFMHPSFRVIYGKGGNSAFAFRILTGQDAYNYATSSNRDESIHPWNAVACADAITCARFYSMGLTEDELASKLKLFKDSFHSPPVKTCFKTFDNFRAWGKYLSHLQNDNNELYERIMHLISKMDELQERMTQYQALELPALLEEFNAPDELIDLIRCYILNPELTTTGIPIYQYSGVAGDGAYTAKQLALVDHIKHLLATNHCMTASTLEKYSLPVPGLRNNHCYSLLDAKEALIEGKTHYFIRLRNPWGEVGRVYLWNQQNNVNFIQEEKAYGEFWLELSDFTRYFVKYTACDPIPGLKLTHTLIQQDIPEAFRI